MVFPKHSSGHIWLIHGKGSQTCQPKILKLGCTLIFHMFALFFLYQLRQVKESIQGTEGQIKDVTDWKLL